jgi:hypothetical protein
MQIVLMRNVGGIGVAQCWKPLFNRLCFACRTHSECLPCVKSVSSSRNCCSKSIVEAMLLGLKNGVEVLDGVCDSMSELVEE